MSETTSAYTFIESRSKIHFPLLTAEERSYETFLSAFRKYGIRYKFELSKVSILCYKITQSEIYKVLVKTDAIRKFIELIRMKKEVLLIFRQVKFLLPY